MTPRGKWIARSARSPSFETPGFALRASPGPQDDAEIGSWPDAASWWPLAERSHNTYLGSQTQGNSAHDRFHVHLASRPR